MDMRLDFQIPEFIRIIWTSPEARKVWESRVSTISNLWPKIERLAVANNTKPLALQTCPPEDLMDMISWCAKRNLVIVPLRQEGTAPNYINASIPFRQNSPWNFRVVIGQWAQVEEFVKLWKSGNDVDIGAALGFPMCCQWFFQANWVVLGWRDLTYPMIGATDGNHFTVEGPRACNILLRWVGVRAVSHLPCSFHCEETEVIGDNLLGVVEDNFPQEAGWLKEMLDWPVRWSSLHGIASITTPVFRVVTSSDALAKTVIIDRPSAVYPAEGATGIEFPFKSTKPLSFIFKDNWTDNGFRSLSAMTKAHDVILKLMGLIPESTVPKVYDLGCGNGLLLQKARAVFPEAKMHGVEIDEKVAAKAKTLLDDVTIGDLREVKWWTPPYGLIIISMARLDEMDKEGRELLLNYLMNGSEYFIVYSYAGEPIDFNLISLFFDLKEVVNDEDSTVGALMESRRLQKEQTG